MIDCPKFGCDAGRMAVLSDKAYFCRRCGQVVTKVDAEKIAAKSKFSPPLGTAVSRVAERREARHEDEPVPRVTKSKKKKTTKKPKKKPVLKKFRDAVKKGSKK